MAGLRQPHVSYLHEAPKLATGPDWTEGQPSATSLPIHLGFGKYWHSTRQIFRPARLYSCQFLVRSIMCNFQVQSSSVPQIIILFSSLRYLAPLQMRQFLPIFSYVKDPSTNFLYCNCRTVTRKCGTSVFEILTHNRKYLWVHSQICQSKRCQDNSCL